RFLITPPDAATSPSVTMRSMETLKASIMWRLVIMPSSPPLPACKKLRSVAVQLPQKSLAELKPPLAFSTGTAIQAHATTVIGFDVDGEAGVDNRTYIRNINTTTQNFSAGVNDYVTVRLSDGRLGHTAVVSSQRYKENIKPLADVSEALYALKPVSFRLKKEYDETQALGFGLIAEEVENVDPALVYCNNKGQVESVRYDMVNAMLLNEFLKEHRKVQEQEATIAQLRKDMENVLARLKEHDSKIQQVSDQIEVSASTPRVVSD